MNSISRPFYQQLLDQLNQMTVRGNRHRMGVYVNLNPDQHPTSEPSRVASLEEDAVVAFHILFERDSADAAWRLATPLRFTE